MKTHKQIANEFCEQIRDIPEVNEVLLYGSVLKGEETKNSDIDLAVIFANEARYFQTDQITGLPIQSLDRIKDISQKLQKEYGIKIDLNPIWEDEFEKGVWLSGTGKYPEKDLLNEVGKSIYNSF